MTWTVRPSRPGDEDALADIYLAMRRATFLWVDPGSFHWEDFAVHTKGERIFVCSSTDGTIAGFLSLWEPEDFIHMLYVRHDNQRQGVGTALLQALPGWPERRYRLKCLVKNVRAKNFYMSLGFQAIGNGSSSEGEYEDLSLAAAP